MKVPYLHVELEPQVQSKVIVVSIDRETSMGRAFDNNPHLELRVLDSVIEQLEMQRAKVAMLAVVFGTSEDDSND